MKKEKVAKRAKSLALSLILLGGLVSPVFSSAGVFAVQVESAYGVTIQTGVGTYDIADKVATDAQGSVYYSATFTGTVDFDPGAGVQNLTNPGAQDAVAKHDGDGNLEWVKLSGGDVYGLATDGQSNLYITGKFRGTIDFDPGAGTDNLTSPGTNRDQAFLTKINADGTYGWTKTFGGTQHDYSFSVDTDSSDNVYIAGSFYDQGSPIDFDPGAGTDNKTSNGFDDAFVTKINADGTYGWTKTFGGSEDYDSAIDIAVTPEGAVYFVGYFYSDGAPLVDFDPGAGTDNQTSNGDTYNFLTKINADESYGWTRVYSMEDYNFNVAVNSSGEPYIAGQLWGSVDFDPGAGTVNYSSIGYYDTYLSKLNSDGIYQWLNVYATTGSDYGYAYVDSQDNAYLTGSISGTVDFDRTSGVDNHTPASSTSGFVTRLNSDDSYEYTRLFQGAGTSRPNQMAVDSNNAVWVAGSFENTVDFDPTPATDNRTSAGSSDAFLTKLTQTTYQQITNLDPSLAAKTLSDVDATDNTITNGTSATIRLSLSDTTPIADVTTTFTTDLNWSTVTADSNLTTGTAFAHNLTAADGTAGTFTLYVPKLPNHTRVGICPGANSIASTTEQCEGLYYLTENTDNNLTTTTIDTQDYWTITGLTGTGGFSAEAAATTTDTDTTDTDALAETGESQMNLVYIALAILGISVIRLRSRYSKAS
jgi:hypothetical protein